MSTFKRGGLTPLRLTQAFHLLEDSISNGATLTEIARSCGLSPTYFAHAFKVSMGVSPYRWLASRRIKKATELLAGSRIPLSEVATKCGFVDQAHFAKSFRKMHGIPPSTWRKHKRFVETCGSLD